jgi:hypothetical protein
MMTKHQRRFFHSFRYCAMAPRVLGSWRVASGAMATRRRAAFDTETASVPILWSTYKMSSDLEIVKRELSRLSDDLAPDEELERMLSRGCFSHLLPRREKLARVAQHVDQSRHHTLNLELEKLRSERRDLVKLLHEQEDRITSLVDELRNLRRSFSTRIRRAKTHHKQDDQTQQLLACCLAQLLELRKPRVKSIFRDDAGLITRVEEERG